MTTLRPIGALKWRHVHGDTYMGIDESLQRLFVILRRVQLDGDVREHWYYALKHSSKPIRLDADTVEEAQAKATAAVDADLVARGRQVLATFYGSMN